MSCVWSLCFFAYFAMPPPVIAYHCIINYLPASFSLESMLTEDIASDEIGKYVIRDLASKKPVVAAKTSPKRKKESNASHEVTRRVRPKISSTVERSARVHD